MFTKVEQMEQKEERKEMEQQEQVEKMEQQMEEIEQEDLDAIGNLLTEGTSSFSKIDDVVDISTPDEIQEQNLQHIMNIRDHIENVRSGLAKIIESLDKNPSMISKIAETWNNLSPLEKVGTGVVLTIPLLCGGGTLAALGGATGVVYTGTAIMLEDYNSNNEQHKERLKEGINSIVDILELTIGDLDNIRMFMAEGVKKFNEENLKLTQAVTVLQDKINILTINIQSLQETAESYLAYKKILEQDINNNKANNDIKKEELAEKQKALNLATVSYNKVQAQVMGELNNLSHLRRELSNGIDRTQHVSSILDDAITSLSKNLIAEKNQNEKFYKILENLVVEKKEAANKVITRMSNTQTELEMAKTDLMSNNERCKALLEKQEKMLQNMESFNVMLLKGVGPSGVHGTLFNNKALAEEKSQFSPVIKVY